MVLCCRICATTGQLLLNLTKNWLGVSCCLVFAVNIGPDAETFVKQQDPFTRAIFQAVEKHLGVSEWGKKWKGSGAFSKSDHLNMCQTVIKKIQGNLQSHTRRIGLYARVKMQTNTHCRGGIRFIEPPLTSFSLEHLTETKLEEEEELPVEPAHMQKGENEKDNPEEDSGKEGIEKGSLTGVGEHPKCAKHADIRHLSVREHDNLVWTIWRTTIWCRKFGVQQFGTVVCSFRPRIRSSGFRP